MHSHSSLNYKMHPAAICPIFLNWKISECYIHIYNNIFFRVKFIQIEYFVLNMANICVKVF